MTRWKMITFHIGHICNSSHACVSKVQLFFVRKHFNGYFLLLTVMLHLFFPSPSAIAAGCFPAYGVCPSQIRTSRHIVFVLRKCCRCSFVNLAHSQQAIFVCISLALFVLTFKCRHCFVGFAQMQQALFQCFSSCAIAADSVSMFLLPCAIAAGCFKCVSLVLRNCTKLPNDPTAGSVHFVLRLCGRLWFSASCDSKAHKLFLCVLYRYIRLPWTNILH